MISRRCWERYGTNVVIEISVQVKKQSLCTPSLIRFNLVLHAESCLTRFNLVKPSVLRQKSDMVTGMILNILFFILVCIKYNKNNKKSPVD